MNSAIWTGLTLFAQEGAPAMPMGGWVSILTLWLPIGFLFYFLLIRPQKREQANRQAMIDAVKKNDRVVTSGGIYGLVTNVYREANEVTIRVDENNNTKLRVTISAIARVLGDDSSDETSSK